ncbi:UNVERIFIED_CONTAM: hypothetical protein PYX00_002335 [Menopon gallinae]|uniref:TBC1 domain family member 7 n=1 Tax=Menopon gallinae TaxID=328185 RepID=A0AAW2IHN6_9NEOP
MMTADERNFRSSYYEKVGFRNVEEKKSLEILLKDNPPDCIKLKQFCLRFTVPGLYRNLLWKLLLNVTPRYMNNLKFVTAQRTEVYEELVRALQVMKLINNDTPKPDLFLLMWLLETGQLKFDLNLQMDDMVFKGFTAISNSLIKIFDDDVDTYWISKGFYTSVKNFHDCIPKLVEASKTILEREDKVLFKHLSELGIFDGSEIAISFNCLFADILHETALVKIWDKIVGGSFKILPFVAVILFTTLRRNLLNITCKSTVFDELKGITEEISEVIANKAIELWQQYGSLLVIGDTHKEKINADNS